MAKASKLTPDAIRFYERRGLLPRPARSAGGFLQYDTATLDRLRFIKQAQAHGLTLREVRDLLGSQARAGRDRCRRVRDLVAKRLHDLDDQRRALDAFCATLRRYLTMCDRALAADPCDCPVVEDLGREARKRSAAS
ncbi:MAG: MerR family transcriptional regulator [Vicinamibacterales bacterium]